MELDPATGPAGTHAELFPQQLDLGTGLAHHVKDFTGVVKAGEYPA